MRCQGQKCDERGRPQKEAWRCRDGQTYRGMEGERFGCLEMTHDDGGANDGADEEEEKRLRAASGVIWSLEQLKWSATSAAAACKRPLYVIHGNGTGSLPL